MAVAIVQSNGASSVANNSTLRLNGVAPGNMLLACCLQNSLTHPPAPTSSRGDVFEDWGGSGLNDGGGLQFGFYRLRSAVGGNTTLTFTTSAASAVAVIELSGVHADVGGLNTLPWTEQPNDYANSCRSDTAFATEVTPGTAGDFLLSFAAAIANVAYVAPPGWTIIRQIASAKASLCLVQLTPAATTNPLSVTFTTPSVVPGAVCTVALTPA